MYRYSLQDGASFAEQAKYSTFDLTTDEGVAEKKRRDSQLKWDRKKKKFVKGDGAGADNVKMIKTESGAKLPISYRSGRFDEWKAKTRKDMPKVGEMESSKSSRTASKKFSHNKVTAPKALDRLAHDYERKLRVSKKKAQAAAPKGEPSPPPVGKKGKKPLKAGRWKGKTIGRVKTELKTVDQIRRQRDLIRKRREKNARPSKKKR